MNDPRKICRPRITVTELLYVLQLQAYLQMPDNLQNFNADMGCRGLNLTPANLTSDSKKSSIIRKKK